MKVEKKDGKVHKIKMRSGNPKRMKKSIINEKRLSEDVPYAGTNQIRLKGQHLWILSQPAPPAPLHFQFSNCHLYYIERIKIRLEKLFKQLHLKTKKKLQSLRKGLKL